MSELHKIAKAIVADHKGLLAADESISSATKRLESIAMESTEETRRQYRNVFLTAEGIEKGISGVILFEETFDQKANDGTPFVKVLQDKGIIPGIKVDKGAHDLALYPGEKITDGLDALRERLAGYYSLGARFAKWRAVITIGHAIPTDYCIHANAHALARYAALCQEQGIVPVVEPEVLITGKHTIEISEKVTTSVLKETFKELQSHSVDLQGLILKSSMVISGDECEIQATADQVGEATMRCFKNSVPEDVPGIVFLSGGQSPIQATENLNAVHKQSQGPWTISFSYARALQADPLTVWGGKPENVVAAQKEFIKRLTANVEANKGKYTSDLEK